MYCVSCYVGVIGDWCCCSFVIFFSRSLTDFFFVKGPKVEGSTCGTPRPQTSGYTLADLLRGAAHPSLCLLRRHYFRTQVDMVDSREVARTPLAIPGAPVFGRIACWCYINVSEH